MIGCNQKGLYSTAMKLRQKKVIYQHISIRKFQMRVALGTGNPGWSRSWPELVCWEAWWLHSNEQEVVPASKMLELLAACAKDKLEFKLSSSPKFINVWSFWTCRCERYFEQFHRDSWKTINSRWNPFLDPLFSWRPW